MISSCASMPETRDPLGVEVEPLCKALAEQVAERLGLRQRPGARWLAADSLENQDMCAQLDADANTVGKWRRRYP